MDPERFPDAVREFIAAITECGRCATKRADGLLVAADFQMPIWFIKATCMHCGATWIWQIMGPAPKATTEAEAIREPEWYKAVRS